MDLYVSGPAMQFTQLGMPRIAIKPDQGSNRRGPKDLDLTILSSVESIRTKECCPSENGSLLRTQLGNLKKGVELFETVTSEIT